MKTPTQQIVEAYRIKMGNGNGPLPYRKLADFLGCFTFQELQFIESGQQAVGIEGLRKLIHLYHDTNSDDIRHQFAADLIAATIPEAVAPEGEIGKAAMTDGKAE